MYDEAIRVIQRKINVCFKFPDGPYSEPPTLTFFTFQNKNKTKIKTKKNKNKNKKTEKKKGKKYKKADKQKNY